MVGSQRIVYVPLGTLTVRVATWRSFFSAFAEGEDAYEKRRRLKDQARDLIKTHMPTPFLEEKGENEAPFSTVSKKRVDHHVADGPLWPSYNLDFSISYFDRLCTPFPTRQATKTRLDAFASSLVFLFETSSLPGVSPHHEPVSLPVHDQGRAGQDLVGDELPPDQGLHRVL